MESFQKFRRNFIKIAKYFFMILSSIFILVIFIGVISKYLGFNYIINISPSLPEGIYRLFLIDREIKEGDFIVFLIPEKQKEIIHRYLDEKSVKTLLKKVVGLENDLFEVEERELIGKIIVKNKGEVLGLVSDYDTKGRKLRHIEKIIVGKDEYFVMGTSQKSYDSRYFGTINKKDILYFAKPVLTFW